MKQHQYKITVQHISDKDGNSVNEPPLICDMPTHDNLADILAKTDTNIVSGNDALRLALGLKLLGELILENKNQAFFKELSPHFGEIMKIVKGKK
ncbi:MAG: DUF3861 family protein [Neisseriaceae bacterium]|nr:DUF3861 family protein [Neisseriaceae bacterium]MBR3482814.1 DUF3861 family protein [Neisseriaceae bacterium]